MLVSLKEHRKDVTSIAVTPDNRSFVSSSADGSCIIWDLVRYTHHPQDTLHSHRMAFSSLSSHHMLQVFARFQCPWPASRLSRLT
jgi:WD40 repeat protein